MGLFDLPDIYSAVIALHYLKPFQLPVYLLSVPAMYGVWAQ